MNLNTLKSETHQSEADYLPDSERANFEQKPLINAHDLRQAKNLYNVFDVRLFHRLDALTSAWDKSHPNLELRKEIDCYLTTSRLTPKDVDWVEEAYPDQMNYISPLPLLEDFNQELTGLIRKSFRLQRLYDLPDKLHPVAHSVLNTKGLYHSPFWITPALVDRLKAKREHLFDYRIELNPELEAQLKVFEEVMQLSESQSIPVAGSTINRRHEFCTYRLQTRTHHPEYVFGAYPLQALEARTRTDAITLLTTEHAIDDLLSVVLDIYKRNLEDFNMRSSSTLSANVAPGIGISSTYDQMHHRKHGRNKLIAQAISEAMANTADNQPMYFEDFEYRLSLLAQEWGINPVNLAFRAS